MSLFCCDFKMVLTAICPNPAVLYKTTECVSQCQRSLRAMSAFLPCAAYETLRVIMQTWQPMMTSREDLKTRRVICPRTEEELLSQALSASWALLFSSVHIFAGLDTDCLFTCLLMVLNCLDRVQAVPSLLLPICCRLKWSVGGISFPIHALTASLEVSKANKWFMMSIRQRTRTFVVDVRLCFILPPLAVARFKM